MIHRFENVAIIGVGLLGGSIGLALRDRRLATRVTGYSPRSATLQAARVAGAISETAESLSTAVRDAQLVIVCTPVGRIVEAARAAAASCRDGTIITDVGSTKRQIVSELQGTLPPEVLFVGSHPIAGSHRAGFEHADPNLLEGAVVAVTPVEETPPEAVIAISDFWRALGARVMKMSPEGHDEATAYSSQFPHLVAAALAAATPESVLPLAGPGWRDSTRVAGGSVALWLDILRTNRAPVLQAMAAFGKVLRQWQTALQHDDWDAVAQLLQQGKDRRDTVGD